MEVIGTNRVETGAEQKHEVGVKSIFSDSLEYAHVQLASDRLG